MIENDTRGGAHPLFLLISVLAFGALGLVQMLPNNDADPSIDLTRARAHVAEIAAAPHTMGSRRNHQVRDYIRDQLLALGLNTEVQRGQILYDHPLRGERHVRAASVENILAQLPGRESGPAVLLMSHYDSRPGGPGAADAAAGVAAVLEAAYQLGQGPQPRRDVYFLITDGEEMGLLGAQSFFRDHPLAGNVGLVINLEARGSAGPSMLFETSVGNGDLIASVAEVMSPTGNSLAYEIYRRMPNDTDLTISKGEGLAGINFAFVDRYFDYHTEGDSPANLSLHSLAGHVQAAKVLGNHFANLEALPERSEDRTFFSVLPGLFVHYPPLIEWMVLVLALVLALTLARRGGRLQRDSVLAVLKGLLAALLAAVICSNVAESLYDWMRADSAFADARYWQLLYQYPRAMIGFALIGAGLGCWLLAAMYRGLKPQELMAIPATLAALAFLGDRLSGIYIGALLLIALLLWPFRQARNAPNLEAAGTGIWLTLAVSAAFLAPSGAFFIVLPLLWILACRLAASHRMAALADGLAPALPALLWAPLLYSVYVALGIDMPQLVVIALLLVLLLMAAQAVRLGQVFGGVAALAVAAAGLVVLVSVRVNVPFDERHRQPTELYYLQDQDRGLVSWASGDSGLNPWTRQILGESPEQGGLDDVLPGSRRKIWQRAIEVEPIPSARVEILHDRVEAGRRYLSLLLRSPIGAEYINLLFPPGVDWSGASLDGLSVPIPSDLRESEWWRWRYYALPEAGVQIDLITGADTLESFRIIEVAQGFPDGLDLPARPDHMMRRPYAWSDSSVVFQTVDLRDGQGPADRQSEPSP